MFERGLKLHFGAPVE